MEKETKKILGKVAGDSEKHFAPLSVRVSAHTNRVAVLDGHTISFLLFILLILSLISSTCACHSSSRPRQPQNKSEKRSPSTHLRLKHSTCHLLPRLLFNIYLRKTGHSPDLTGNNSAMNARFSNLIVIQRERKGIHCFSWPT